ncbi:MAG: B12-binding domain-containing radical SAM protein [Methylobacteriaceae bacterium]|nr:B12-binding domain-containing radical SAM protein [Methylobacteriaceae bacterium]
MPSIYIVNPAPDAVSYHTAESYAPGDGRGWVLMADLTIVTLAAMVPQDWDIRIVDEGIDAVDLDAQVDFVAITGKISQRGRMYWLARHFRRRGLIVLIGGCFASLNPEDARPHADILVTGEIEELAPRLFADLAAGTWADRYEGGRCDMSLAPLPRWDLYPIGRAASGTVQTSRGCPFECEFCDVIQYQGRKQRHKDIKLVLRELDHLYALGCRRVFFVDDNFTVHRRRAYALLEALAEWNAARAEDRMMFSTQASLDVARDPELLQACVAAGFLSIFVGIESVNPESLRETGKRQNLLQPIKVALDTIARHGIGIQAGIIAGFDHDGPDVFETLFTALQTFPVPDLSIQALVALHSTPLYARLAREGRLAGEAWEGFSRGPHWTNIIPARMTRTELMDGVAWLARKAYAPESFRQRVLNFIEAFGADAGQPRRTRRQSDERMPPFQTALRNLVARGAAESEMVADLIRAAGRKAASLPAVAGYLVRYQQYRMVVDRPFEAAPLLAPTVAPPALRLREPARGPALA